MKKIIYFSILHFIQSSNRSAQPFKASTSFLAFGISMRFQFVDFSIKIFRIRSILSDFPRTQCDDIGDSYINAQDFHFQGRNRFFLLWFVAGKNEEPLIIFGGDINLSKYSRIVSMGIKRDVAINFGFEDSALEGVALLGITNPEEVFTGTKVRKAVSLGMELKEVLGRLNLSVWELVAGLENGFLGAQDIVL
jgi:hypothetical protein